MDSSYWRAPDPIFAWAAPAPETGCWERGDGCNRSWNAADGGFASGTPWSPIVESADTRGSVRSPTVVKPPDASALFVRGQVTVAGMKAPAAQRPHVIVPPTAKIATTPTAVVPPGQRTTVMLRNLPLRYTREMLMHLIDSEGFAGLYDFAYLPIDFNSRVGLGYAFVNLQNPAEASRFWTHFDGFSRWAQPEDSDVPCLVTWSEPHQGLTSHIERYRNSPVMHQSVPDECKPMIFACGVRAPFPAPTKHIKAPRMRCRN